MANIVRGWNRALRLGNIIKNHIRVAQYPNLRRTILPYTTNAGGCESLQSTPDLRTSDVSDIPREQSTTQSNEVDDTLRESSERGLKRIIHTSNNLDEVWEAFRILIEYKPPPDSILVNEDFKRIFAVLCNQKPRTRSIFLKMMEICNVTHAMGFEMELWQWNAFIDASAKGFHSVREEDYETALGVYNDLRRKHNSKSGRDELDTLVEMEEPGDIVTFTTLLSIAFQTRSSTLVQHASKLLEYSQLPPNRITELAVIPYLTRSGEYHAVKSVIENVHAKGMEVGIDGLNALMWAYAYNEAVEYPLGIYRTLRSNVLESIPAPELEKVDVVTNIGEYVIPRNLAPDRATYTLLIQALAYHGYFVLALEVFRDMIVLPKPPAMSYRYRNAPSEYLPSAHLIPVYRALFLGFSRHGQPEPNANQKPAKPLPEFATQLAVRQKPKGLTPWNVHNLQIIFGMFMESVGDCIPNNRTLFWILKGFARTSRNSLKKMKDVWNILSARFEPSHGWRGRMLRIQEDLNNDEVVLGRTKNRKLYP